MTLYSHDRKLLVVMDDDGKVVKAYGGQIAEEKKLTVNDIEVINPEIVK